MMAELTPPRWTGPRLTDNFIMLQKTTTATYYIFYSNSVFLSDRVTTQKGDYIREKFGSVGVIYLELRA